MQLVQVVCNVFRSYATCSGRMQRVQVHRTVRQWAKRELLRPGMKMIDICEALEDRVIHPFPPFHPPARREYSSTHPSTLEDRVIHPFPPRPRPHPRPYPSFGGIPYRAAVRDTMICGIPSRAGYHALWDTKPCGIPCRVAYHVVRDTVPSWMSCGIPRQSGALLDTRERHDRRHRIPHRLLPRLHRRALDAQQRRQVVPPPPPPPRIRRTTRAE